MEGPYETADDAWVYQDFFTILEITDDYINKELKDQIPNKGPRTKEEGRRTRSKAKDSTEAEEPINDIAK